MHGAPLDATIDRRRIHGEEYAARFERLHGTEHRRLRGILADVALDRSDRVLDIGCGSGLLLPWIADRVDEYVGVDFSAAFIRAANARRAALGVRNARFVCGPVDAVRGPFTVAFALDVSEHIPDAEWGRVLRSVQHVLAPGGRLILHTPDAAFVVERLKAWGVLRQFPEHVAVRTTAHNVRLVAEAGFHVTRTRPLPHYNVLRVLHPLRSVVGPARLWLEARAP